MSLGSPLNKLADGAKRFADDWPRLGAQLIAQSVQKQLHTAPGGGNIRGIGSATVTVDSSPGSADVSAAGSRRVWSWIEDGTSAHRIAARSTRRTDALRTPYGPRRRVKVRGMRAGHTWSTGLARADPQVVRLAIAAQDRIGA